MTISAESSTVTHRHGAEQTYHNKIDIKPRQFRRIPLVQRRLIREFLSTNDLPMNQPGPAQILPIPHAPTTHHRMIHSRIQPPLPE